jgi:hypothetical protein
MSRDEGCQVAPCEKCAFGQLTGESDQGPTGEGASVPNNAEMVFQSVTDTKTHIRREA